MAVGFPVGAEQREGLGGQGDVAVFGALAAMDMALEAWAIDVGDLEEEGFVEPESQAIDRGEGDLVMHGGGGHEEPLDLFHTEDRWKPVCGLRANEGEGVPVTLEDVLVEKANAAVADAHGRGGQVVDIFAVQEVALQLLFREEGRRFAIELSQQADCTDIGCLRPFALATELESRNHLLTQWGHEMSPFVRRVVCVRREPS
jgi:hypothetical protein